MIEKESKASREILAKLSDQHESMIKILDEMAKSSK